MKVWGVLGLGLVMAGPAAADEPAGLPAVMWERIQGVQPEALDLSPTPSPRPPDELSLKQCIELSFGHNADFRSAQESLVAAREGLWVADQRLRYTATGAARRERPSGASATTSASASASATWEQLGGDAVGLTLGTGSKRSFSELLTERPSVSLTYDRPILRGAGLASSTYERVRSARVGLVSQELAFYEAHQSLALRIIERYFRALRAQGEIEIARRRLERAERFYHESYVKFTGEGIKQPDEPWVTRVAQIDVDQARLARDRARQAVIRQEQAFRDAMDDLLLEMGFLPGSTPQLTTRVQYAPQDYDEAALIETGLANSIALARLALSRENALAQRRQAYSSAKPDLTAELGVTDHGETLGEATGSASWFAGVRVDVPLWDRSRAQRKASAERGLEVLAQDIIAAGDREAQRVRGLVRAAESGRASIAIGEENAKLAQKSRDMVQAMYEAGVRGYQYLQVLDAEDSLVAAERSLLEEKINYFLTTVRIRQALGEDVTRGLPE